MTLTSTHPHHGPCLIEYDYERGYPASWTGPALHEHVAVYSVLCEGVELVEDEDVYAWAELMAWGSVPQRRERW